MQKLKNYLENYPKAQILDVGTGRGDFINMITHLTDDFTEIIGIDTHEGMLNLAKKQFSDERIKFEQMDGLNTTYKDQTFDIVCFSNSLHHLTDLFALFKEMERIVKPKGIIIINEMISDGLDKRQTSHKLIHHFAASIDRAIGVVHGETYTSSDMISIIETNTTCKINDHWYLEVPKKPSNSQEEIDQMVTTVDRLLERVKNHEAYLDFEKEGALIKEHLNTYGIDSATQQIVIIQAP